MALTASTLIDAPTVLVVAWVDDALANGAVGKVEVTNRGTRSVVLWVRYLGALVYSPPIVAGGTVMRTLRGNVPRAGDVSEIGYY